MEFINLNGTMPTKSNIDVLANAMIEPVINGEKSALETMVNTKFAIEVLSKVLSAIEENATSELGNEKEYILFGAKIEHAEVGSKYYYNECDSWNNIKDAMKPLETQLKSVETTIKMACKLGKHIVDDVTGETISPVKKESKSTVKITLSK